MYINHCEKFDTFSKKKLQAGNPFNTCATPKLTWKQKYLAFNVAAFDAQLKMIDVGSA
jgi:hypothetical protein